MTFTVTCNFLVVIKKFYKRMVHSIHFPAFYSCTLHFKPVWKLFVKVQRNKNAIKWMEDDVGNIPQ